MGNIKSKNNVFRASRQSCVLTSYTHLLNLFNEKQQITPNQIFLAYIKYFRELNNNAQISAEELVSFGKGLWNFKNHESDYDKILKSYNSTYKVSQYGTTVRELLSSVMLHYECKKLKNNISGYKHLIEFNEWFEQNNSQNNIGLQSKLAIVDSYFGDNGSIDSIQEKENILKNITSVANRALLILYKTDRGGHSIMVHNKDGQLYKIDPNVGLEQQVNWEDINILEYIIFENI